MKRFLLIPIILLMSSPVFAISRDAFVLNVINAQQQVKEISGQVVLPFDTEYKLRLANQNERRAVAKIMIDGIPVSNLGDFVIPANGDVVLERFLDRSLTEGRKFKFVRLDHPEVQDPYSKENGIVKVEFRLERTYEPYLIIWGGGTFTGERILPDTFTFSSLTTGTRSTLETGSWPQFSTTSINCSASIGATVGGSESRQAFRQVEFDLEEVATILTLKMLGI